MLARDPLPGPESPENYPTLGVGLGLPSSGPPPVPEGCRREQRVGSLWQQSALEELLGPSDGRGGQTAVEGYTLEMPRGVSLVRL